MVFSSFFWHAWNWHELWHFQARSRNAVFREACEQKSKLDSIMIGIKIHMKQDQPSNVCPSTAVIFLYHAANILT